MLWKRRALSTDIDFMTISDSPGGIDGFNSIGGFALPCTCWYMTAMWSPRWYGGSPVSIS